MKAILGITLCLMVVWMTALNPQPVAPGGAPPAAMEIAPHGEAGITAESGVPAVLFTADLAEAEGGWWNWLRKVLRAILDLIPGGDEECGDQPQN